MADDLIERLRRGRLSYNSKSGPVYAGPTLIETAAADALASKDKALEEMRAELERVADCLDCARLDWESNNGEIINKSDPHWTVEARRLVAARAQAEEETP